MKTPPSYQDQFETLMNYEGQPAEKLAHYRRAIEVADLHQDDSGSLRARLLFISVGLFEGRHDENLLHFVKCIEICKHNPILLTLHSKMLAVLGRSTLTSLARYASISRAQLVHAAEETIRLYELAGIGARPLHQTRMRLAIILGDLGQVATHRDRFLATPPQPISECPACETASICRSFVATNQLDEALARIRGLLDGTLTCDTEPAGTDAVLLLPLLRAGNLALAQRLMGRSFNTVRDEIGCFDDTGRFMAYLVATDQLTRAVDMLQAGLANFLVVRRDSDRFWMLSGACLLLHRLTQIRPAPIHLRLPPALPCHRPDNRYDPAALLAWADPQLQSLAQRFDARNGNPHYSNILRDLDTLLKHITPIPDGNPSHEAPRLSNHV